jgi:catechol 2,3-dioxygenase-like lactoylglutathione lyase family enzyme
MSGVHHVGHVVRDMTAGLALYRRLGFTVPPPVYPALPREGGAPEPFGAANTHAELAQGFLELATVATGDVPPDARVIPLTSPGPDLLAPIEATTRRLAGFLDEGEGLHILVFASSDVDVTAARLDAAGVPHDGVATVHAGAQTVRYLDAHVPGGRVGVATGNALGGEVPSHLNGAEEVADVVLSVPDPELDGVRDRYERLLDRAARAEGPVLALDLDRARVTLVPASALDTVLPGERPPRRTAIAGVAVTVADLDATRRLLTDRAVPTHPTPRAGVLVPSHAALGAAIEFRPRRTPHP